ncbi:MAG: acyltransferase family protein [Gammaproteobacteria bacterium]
MRAWAVVSVILYHFGVPGMQGGFVGVDVFFAISGFLMTGIVVRGLEAGRFSLLAFYAARTRRIVPALTVLCVTLLLLGYLFLPPPDYRQLGAHSTGALTFLSNIQFFSEAGYFDTASHDKWLLHTWSLSVEWQFYLLLPVLLSLVWKWWPGRRALLVTTVSALAVSLLAAVAATPGHPTAAFFLLPTRAWEMLAGGLVYLLAPPRAGGARRGWDSAGIALIVASIALFDTHSPWPGWRALVPVVGAMLVLAGESNTSPWTASRVAQWLGDRSYSLYLWHWTVFVAIAFVDRTGDPATLAAGLALTLLLGELSYRYVERPTRTLWQIAPWKVGVRTLAAVGVLVLAPALAIQTMDGVPGRLPGRVEAAAMESTNVNPRRNDCHTRDGASSPSCIWGGTQWRVIALGDSHASAAMTSLAAASPTPDAGVVQWTYSGCAYVQGMKLAPEHSARLGSSYRCEDFIGWATRTLAAQPASIPVVLMNRYAALAMGDNLDAAANGHPVVYFDRPAAVSSPAYLAEFGRHITDTACTLARQRTVYLMRPIPEMGLVVPKAMSRRLAFGLNEDISISMDEYRQRNEWVWRAQDEAQRRCGVKILDPLPYLCHDGRCYGSQHGRPLYSDADHLSEYGNKLLVPMFRQVYAQQVARR